MVEIKNRVPSDISGHDASSRSVSWEQSIAAIALQIRQSLELATIWQTTVEAVQQLLNCERTLLYQLIPGDGGQVVVEAVQHPQWSLLGQVIHDACFEASWLEPYEEQQVRAIADISTANLTPCHAEFLAGFQVKANLVVPILCESQLWGLLIAHSCVAPRPWLSEEIAGLQQIAVQVGVAIYQAELVAQLRAAKADLEDQVVKTLQQSRDQRFQLAAIVESSQDAIISNTPEGVITSWNRAAEQLFGFTAQEAIGQLITLIIPLDRQDEAISIFQQLNQGKRVETYETQKQHKDGHLVDVEVTISPMQDETGTVVIGASKIIRNITQQRRTQQALHEQTAILQSFYNSSPLMMGIVELSDHDILHISDNQATAAFFNTTIAALAGQWTTDLGISTDHTQAWIAHCRHSQTSGQPVQFDYAHTIETTTSWLSFVVSFIGIAESQRPRFSYVATDISERKQAEDELRHLNLAMEHAVEGISYIDSMGRYLSVNRAYASICGCEPRDLIGTAWSSTVHADDLPLLESAHETMRTVGKVEVEARGLRQDGSLFHKQVTMVADYDAQGRFVGHHCFLKDISERKQAEADLRVSEARWQFALEGAGDGIWDWNPQTNTVFFSRQWKAMLGYSEAEISTANNEWSSRIHPDDLEQCHADLQRHFSGETPVYQNEHRVRCKDGTYKWVLDRGQVIEWTNDHQPLRVIGTYSDMSDRKQAELDLKQAKEQLESRVDELKLRNDEMQRLGEMSDFLQACLTVDEAYKALGTLVAPLFGGSSGAIFMLNASRNRMEIVTTWGPELNSQPLFSSFSPSDCWALRRGRPHQVAPNSLGLRCHHAETAAVTSTTLCLPLLAQGETLGLFYLSASEMKQPTQQLARAVAEQVALALANLQLRETLQYQSIRDPLTGLYNRRYLEETLTQEIERAQRHRHPIGVIMLDIDHFKRFNDVHGHAAGDRVLEAVGQLLRDSVRGSDIACRYGGEEMTLVLPESPPDVTLARAEAIRYAISQLRVSYNGMTLERLSASLGVASFPDHGATGIDVVKAADVALYQAKSRGRNQVVVYSTCNESS